MLSGHHAQNDHVFLFCPIGSKCCIHRNGSTQQRYISEKNNFVCSACCYDRKVIEKENWRRNVFQGNVFQRFSERVVKAIHHCGGGLSMTRCPFWGGSTCFRFCGFGPFLERFFGFCFTFLRFFGFDTNQWFAVQAQKRTRFFGLRRFFPWFFGLGRYYKKIELHFQEKNT